MPHIFARAIDSLHESILRSFDIDRILTPEQRAAKDLMYEMELGSQIASLKVDEDHYILKFNAPSELQGESYAQGDFVKNMI